MHCFDEINILNSSSVSHPDGLNPDPDICRIRIRNHAVAELGSNPDPDQSSFNTKCLIKTVLYVFLNPYKDIQPNREILKRKKFFPFSLFGTTSACLDQDSQSGSANRLISGSETLNKLPLVSSSTVNNNQK